jgi:polyphosphate kinase 2 (PPK2 family)
MGSRETGRCRDDIDGRGQCLAARGKSRGARILARRARFYQAWPVWEKQIVDSGIRILKYWLEVSPAEQKGRFQAAMPRS